MVILRLLFKEVWDRGGRRLAIGGRQPVGLPPAEVVVVRKVRHHRPGSAWGLGPAGPLQRGQPPHVVPRPVELPGRGGQRVVLPPQRSPRDPSLLHSLLHHVGRQRPLCRLWVKASRTDDKSHLSVTLARSASSAEHDERGSVTPWREVNT